MKVYYIAADCGDGSSRMEFYDSKDCIDLLTDDDRYLEDYMDGDDVSWGVFEVPNGTQFWGIEINTFDYLKKEYGEN